MRLHRDSSKVVARRLLLNHNLFYQLAKQSALRQRSGREDVGATEADAGLLRVECFSGTICRHTLVQWRDFGQHSCIQSIRHRVVEYHTGAIVRVNLLRRWNVTHRPRKVLLRSTRVQRCGVIGCHNHRIVEQLRCCLPKLRFGEVVGDARCFLICDAEIGVELSGIEILCADLSRRQELARWLLFAVCRYELDVNIDVFSEFCAKLIICDVYRLTRALVRVVLTCLAILSLQQARVVVAILFQLRVALLRRNNRAARDHNLRGLRWSNAAVNSIFFLHIEWRVQCRGGLAARLDICLVERALRLHDVPNRQKTLGAISLNYGRLVCLH